MAGSFSNFAELEILDHVFSAAAYTAPANLHFALCTAAPTDASTGSTITEPAGGSYARVSVTNNATNFPAAASGSKSNGTAITFPTATGSWGTVTHVAVVDAGSGGNVICWASLDTSKTVDTGDTVSFGVGAFTITLD